MEHKPNNNDAEMPAPPKLVAALRRTQAKSLFVPRTVDETILRAARQQLTPATKPKQSGLWGSLRWPALATASIVLCLVAYQVAQPLLRPRPSVHARPDLNRDGRIDILDAFLIARELEAGAAPPTEFDVNGDGKVDGRDVEYLASRAVKLEKGGPS